MKRIVYPVLFVFGLVAFSLLWGGCYLPKTPTPHLGMTLPPAPTPGFPQGLVTPGITVGPQVGPTQPQPANPPGFAGQTPFPTLPSPTPLGGGAPTPVPTTGGGLPESPVPSQ
jgi:hypothetical protein